MSKAHMIREQRHRLKMLSHFQYSLMCIRYTTQTSDARIAFRMSMNDIQTGTKKAA
jgi:hypothetical protein